MERETKLIKASESMGIYSIIPIDDMIKYVTNAKQEGATEVFVNSMVNQFDSDFEIGFLKSAPEEESEFQIRLKLKEIEDLEKEIESLRESIEKKK